METTTKATHAWVHLTRLCGCNYKIEIERRGRSVFVKDPQGPKTFRVDAAKFDAGKAQFRQEWCIEPWTDQARETTAREANWQD